MTVYSSAKHTERLLEVHEQLVQLFLVDERLERLERRSSRLACHRTRTWGFTDKESLVQALVHEI